jgi:alpha-L-rhamnosidase
MFGEIGAWLYKGIGGIRPDPSQPGFKNVILSPNFVTGLDHFEATHRGPYGMIGSSWARTAGSIVYTVNVPPNSTATVILPAKRNAIVTLDGKPVAGRTSHLQSGTHRFVIAE